MKKLEKYTNVQIDRPRRTVTLKSQKIEHQISYFPTSSQGGEMFERASERVSSSLGLSCISAVSTRCVEKSTLWAKLSFYLSIFLCAMLVFLMAQYHLSPAQAFRQQRMAELQEKSKKGVFGDVREISAEDYKQQVA